MCVENFNSIFVHSTILQDVDAYIHRSGRTGRAGRTGICVMFYKPREEYRIPQVHMQIHALVNQRKKDRICAARQGIQQ